MLVATVKAYTRIGERFYENRSFLQVIDSLEYLFNKAILISEVIVVVRELFEYFAFHENLTVLYLLFQKSFFYVSCHHLFGKIPKGEKTEEGKGPVRNFNEEWRLLRVFVIQIKKLSGADQENSLMYMEYLEHINKCVEELPVAKIAGMVSDIPHVRSMHYMCEVMVELGQHRRMYPAIERTLR